MLPGTTNLQTLTGTPLSLRYINKECLPVYELLIFLRLSVVCLPQIVLRGDALFVDLEAQGSPAF